MFRHVCAAAIALQFTVHVHVQDSCSCPGIMFMLISRLSRLMDSHVVVAVAVAVAVAVGGGGEGG
jgi:hypothetical protein